MSAKRYNHYLDITEQAGTKYERQVLLDSRLANRLKLLDATPVLDLLPDLLEQVPAFTCRVVPVKLEVVNRATNQVERRTINLFAACTTTRVILTWVQEESMQPRVEFPDED